jgi:hypothetical protein
MGSFGILAIGDQFQSWPNDHRYLEGLLRGGGNALSESYRTTWWLTNWKNQYCTVGLLEQNIQRTSCRQASTSNQSPTARNVQWMRPSQLTNSPSPAISEFACAQNHHHGYHIDKAPSRDYLGLSYQEASSLRTWGNLFCNKKRWRFLEQRFFNRKAPPRRLWVRIWIFYRILGIHYFSAATTLETETRGLSTLSKDRKRMRLVRSGLEWRLLPLVSNRGLVICEHLFCGRFGLLFDLISRCEWEPPT